MSNGGAQAHVITLTAYPSFKLYHYIEGTSTAKDIYTDEAMTTPSAQPMVADATGTIQFYGDGMYKFVIDDSADVTKHTWDNVRVSSDLATMGVNFGTTVPSATTVNQGQLFAEHEATTQDFEALWINHGGGAGGVGPAFLKIIDVVGGIEKKADLILGGPVIDVRYYDATGDGVTDDSAAIQAAATAVSSTGGGLYFPKGTYLMTSDIDVVNKPIHIFGDGIGISTIKWSSGVDYGIDFDSTNRFDNLIIDNITLDTDFAGAGDAVNAVWPVGSGTVPPNFIMKDVVIGSQPSNYYFTRGIVTAYAYQAQLDNVHVIGKNSDNTLMTHGIFMTDGDSPHITNCGITFTQYGVMLSGALSESIIVGNTIEYTDEGIHYNFAAVQNGHKASLNNIRTFSRGIRCTYLRDSNINNNNLVKQSVSTDDFIGIELESTSITNQVNHNSIREAGTSGTDIGISSDSNKGTISNNIIEDQDTGITTTGNDLTVTNNNVTAVTTGITINGDDCLVEGNLSSDAVTGFLADTASNTCYFASNRAQNTTNDYTDNGTGNKWENNYLPNAAAYIASATTITLPPEGAAFSITGSTTIDNITNSWDGRIVTLFKEVGAAGSVTMRNVGNMRLLGGVNRTIVAETAIQVMYSAASNGWLQTSESIN